MNNVSHLIKKFPVVWSKKDLDGNVRPTFTSDVYINFLQTISDFYQELPESNLEVQSLYDIEDYDKDFLKIYEKDVIEVIQKQCKDQYKPIQKAIEVYPELVSIIAKCYNSILFGNFELTSRWRYADISAKFKGGEDRGNPSKFRPLMVLPIVVRIMDTIISKKIHDVVLKYNVIDTRIQKSALKNCSGLWENSFVVNKKICEMVETNDDSKLFFFIDLKNAFGSVNYGKIVKIFEKYNFCPQITSYFKRYYECVYGVYKFKKFKWTNGLFQGSAASNIYFLIYIDFVLKDFFKSLREANLIDGFDIEKNAYAFVDDMVMVLPRNRDISAILRVLNDKMSEYGFEINKDKTYFVVNDVNIKTLTFDGAIYKKAPVDFKYLGHSLFIYEDEILLEMYDKLLVCLDEIRDLPVDENMKAYFYYSCIFLRINRIIELFYLIHGLTPFLEDILLLISNFLLDLGGENCENYEEKHIEHVFSKAKSKLLRSPNLQEYHYLVDDVNDDISYDFNKLCGFEVPSVEDVRKKLQELRASGQYSDDLFDKGGRTGYSQNFVSRTD